MTNDIGEYRIFGLPPGQYYLSATLRGMAMGMDATSDDRSGYAPTYYPGTPSVAEAQRVTVNLGQALGDLNMALAPTRTARISGTVVDSDGRPLVGGFITVLQRLTNNPSEVSGFVTNTRGESVKDYTVVVFAEDHQRWRFGSRYLGQGRPDQDGRFKLRNLPAGQYYAIALAYVEPGEGSDPEFLEMVRDRALTFRLNEGEIKTLDLKLTSGS